LEDFEMKRLIAILLTSALLLATTACSENTSSESGGGGRDSGGAQSASSANGGFVGRWYAFELCENDEGPTYGVLEFSADGTGVIRFSDEDEAFMWRIIRERLLIGQFCVCEGCERDIWHCQSSFEYDEVLAFEIMPDGSIHLRGDWRGELDDDVMVLSRTQPPNWEERLGSHLISSQCADEIADAKTVANTVAATIAEQLTRGEPIAVAIELGIAAGRDVIPGARIEVTESPSGDIIIAVEVGEHGYSTRMGAIPCDSERCPGRIR
jgi:predicted small secreted protein